MARGGFAIRQASIPLPRGVTARAKPSLQAEARRRRRARELGLEEDPEAVRARAKEEQLAGEERAEQRQIRGEQRAHGRRLEIEAGRAGRAQAKAEATGEAKAQKELDKLNASRRLVGLSPVGQAPTTTAGFLRVEPGEVERARAKLGAPQPTASFGGQPTLAEAQAEPAIKLSPKLQEAVAEGLLTPVQASVQQSKIDAEMRRGEAKVGAQEKRELAAGERETALAATLAELEQDLTPEEFEERLASAKARKMSPTELAADIRREQTETAKAAKEAGEIEVEEKVNSVVEAWGSGATDRRTGRRQREIIMAGIREDLVNGTQEEREIAKKALAAIKRARTAK
jgi:hypothetical protein